MKRFIVLALIFFAAFLLCQVRYALAQGDLKKSTAADAVTPAQVKAKSYLDNLIARLSKQGKNKGQIYTLISGQTESLFSGNIVFDVQDENTPWIMTPDGKLHVYSLAGSRDEVLAYVYQALMLKNDPLYEAKRSEWIEAVKSLNALKVNLTFESDYKKIKALEDRIVELSKDIARRQAEIFS